MPTRLCRQPEPRNLRGSYYILKFATSTKYNTLAKQTHKEGHELKYDIEYLRRAAGMTEKRIEAMEKYYATLPIELKIEVEKIKTDLYFQYKNELLHVQKKPEFNYAMKLRAVTAMYSIENFFRTKNPDIAKANTVTDLKIARIKAEKKAKTAPVKAWVEDHFNDITELRERNVSWREISAYLKRFNRKNVNASYLRKIYLEMAHIIGN